MTGSSGELRKRQVTAQVPVSHDSGPHCREVQAPHDIRHAYMSCVTESLRHLHQSMSGSSVENWRLSSQAAPVNRPGQPGQPHQHSAATPAAPAGMEREQQETGHECGRLLLAQALRGHPPGLSPNALLVLEALCDCAWGGHG